MKVIHARIIVENYTGEELLFPHNIRLPCKQQLERVYNRREVIGTYNEVPISATTMHISLPFEKQNVLLAIPWDMPVIREDMIYPIMSHGQVVEFLVVENFHDVVFRKF